MFVHRLSCSYKTLYVDLFVRASNDVAINMYKKFGYSVYQRVLGYYSAGVGHRKEDGLGACFF